MPNRRVFRRRLNRPAFQRRLPPAFRGYLSLGITLGLVVILGLALFIFEGVFTDRIVPHVSVDGIPLGGVSLVDAPAYLHRKEAEYNLQPIVLHTGKQTFQVTSHQFHARYIVDPALALAMREGHDSDLLTRLWNQLQTMVQGHNYAVAGSHDRLAIRRYIKKLDSQVTLPPLPAIVGVRGSQAVILRQPVLGQRLDLEGAVQKLDQAITNRSDFDVILPMQTTAAPVTLPIAQVAVDQANVLLSQSTFFSFGAKIRAWELKPAQLAKLLTFTTVFNAKHGYAVALGIDKRKLRAVMAPIAAQANHLPSPATYIVAQASSGGQDFAVAQPDGPGLTIDTDSTAALILQAANTTHTVVIPPLHPHAVFDLAAARKLGFDTEQGKAVTLLLGSSHDRLTNVRAAALSVDNTLLKPGATFSMTGVISPLTLVHGYVLGLNQTAPQDISGVNGGSNQVASALFQAAYQAGLPIQERVNYPYLTAFNGSIGYDAMVVARPQGPNLQIVNNTKHILVILIPKPKDATTPLSVYIFNNSSVNRSVQVTPPVVTLNQDGSADVTISRVISGDSSGQDTLASHYDALDPYP